MEALQMSNKFIKFRHLNDIWPDPENTVMSVRLTHSALDHIKMHSDTI